MKAEPPPKNRYNHVSKPPFDTGSEARRKHHGAHGSPKVDSIKNGLQHLSISNPRPRAPTHMKHSKNKTQSNRPLRHHLKSIARRVQDQVGKGKYEAAYQQAFVSELLRLGYHVKSTQRETYNSLQKQYQYSDRTVHDIYHRGTRKKEHRPVSDDMLSAVWKVPDVIAKMDGHPPEIVELKAEGKLEKGFFSQTDGYRQHTGVRSAYLVNFGVLPAEAYEIHDGQEFFSPLFDNGEKTVTVSEPAVNEYLKGSMVKKNYSNGSSQKLTLLPHAGGEVFPPGYSLQRSCNSDRRGTTLQNKSATKSSREKSNQRKEAPNSAKTSRRSASHAVDVVDTTLRKCNSPKQQAKAKRIEKKASTSADRESPRIVSAPNRTIKSPNSNSISTVMKKSSRMASATKQHVHIPRKKGTKKQNRPIGFTKRLDI